jgi:hypothetical protein
MKTVIQTIRWEYFYAMGNNCRLHGMNANQAETVIEQSAGFANDFEDFWTGYLNGRSDEIVALPSIDNVI